MADPILDIQQLSVHAGQRTILHEITCAIPANQVFGIIGPSGAGKSTLLRSINRLAELTPGLNITGQIQFRGSPIYAAAVDPDELRTKIGMLFQQPVIFPGSILHNVLFAGRQLNTTPKKERAQLAEAMLRQVALWDEVKDRLQTPANRLSIGQQQRLCLARTLAIGPEIILMDEPTSALDPKATEAIEQLILELSATCTVIIVTHDIPQSKRICQQLAEIALEENAGRLVNYRTV